MLQATIGDRRALDPVALGEDLCGAAEVDVSRRHVVEALVVVGVVEWLMKSATCRSSSPGR